MKRKRIIDTKRVCKASEYEFCECVVPFIERFEDYTYKLLGQELTRNIHVEFCPLCGEKWVDGASITEMEKEIKAKVLSLANERFEVPIGYEYLKYYDEVDTLIISYSNTDSVISKDDLNKSLLYDFDADGNLTGIEVWDFYGKFTKKGI